MKCDFILKCYLISNKLSSIEVLEFKKFVFFLRTEPVTKPEPYP